MSTEMVKQEERTPERVSERPAVAPLVDLYENDDELLLVADMPGVAKDGLEIQFHDGVLSLEGRRDIEREGQTLVRAEYRVADFVRHFTVPDGIDVAKIEATLTDGVLRLRLPKAAALKPRKIEIKAG
jgi:HSP20 family molecular chaperone IbpA